MLVTKRFYLCWTLIGLPILVGPFIALERFLRSFHTISQQFNAEHTFPLSEEELESVIPAIEEPVQRKSIIDQIIVPDEEEPVRFDDEDYAKDTP